jgi:hypothetical protein
MMDKWKQSNKPFIEYSAVEIYRELIEEKKGATATSEE